MVDFRVADTAPEHPKLRAVGLAPIGLWAMAGAYAMRELTDGWVPAYWVQTWPAGARHAAQLVRSGLWTPEAVNGINGYRFHDWTDIQRAREQIEEERRQARERMRRFRERSEEVRANNGRNHGVSDGRSYGERSRNVHDSHPNPSGGWVGRSTYERGRAAPEPPAPPPDPDVARRGSALVRSELDAARARREARERGAS